MKKIIFIFQFIVCLCFFFSGCSAYSETSTSTISVTEHQKELAQNIYFTASNAQSIHQIGINDTMYLSRIKLIKQSGNRYLEFEYATPSKVQSDKPFQVAGFVTSEYYIIGDGMNTKVGIFKTDEVNTVMKSVTAISYWRNTYSQEEQINELYNITQYL